jgi:glycosyltransferase involved in cell wall biosynthesis
VSDNLLVSAIIPTYNRAHIICEAVDSALAQTYPRVEVIVVDDGSKDDTLARLQQYGNRIHVVTQANAGAAAARNRGIAEARGELIAFLDSDDIWLAEKTERQVDLLQRAGASVPCCLSNILMKWNSGDRNSFDIACLTTSAEEGLWLNVDEVLATRSVLFNQGIIIRRQTLEKIGGFDEKIRYLEDYELPLRLSLEGPWAFIKTPLVVWRESMTNSVYKNSLREELCTNECMVQVFEGHLARVQKSGRQARLQSSVKRELTRARRQLWTSRVSQKGAWGSALSTSMRTFERYRSALSRRLPWYPKMEVALAKSSDEMGAILLQPGSGQARDSSERLVG